MSRPSTTIGLIALTAAIAAVFLTLISPGCNQNNSPISVSTVEGRRVLSVACSTDGSVAFVTDGRNVYRYERKGIEGLESWKCILSQGERLAIAIRHDPNEQQTPAR